MDAEALDDEFDTQNLAGIANQSDKRSQSVLIDAAGLKQYLTTTLDANEEDLTGTLKA